MSLSKNVLITAASGNIGKILVPLLHARNPSLKLVLPTTNKEQLVALNSVGGVSASENIEIEEGSIRDPQWFEAITKKHDVDTLFLCVTGTDELFTALNCLDAAKKAGTVKKLIYLSIIGDFTSKAGMRDTYTHRSYPHLYAKVVVENKLLYGDFPFAWTVLGATTFFSNDLRLKVPLTQMGLLPEPQTAQGISKISLEDISLATMNVILDESGKWNSKKIQLGSKHSYTTSEIGELWSKALGKPIKTLPGTREVLDQFEQNLRNAMGPGLDGLAWARDLRLLTEYITVRGHVVSESDYQEQVQLLGKEPDNYEAWVKKLAASWV